MITSPDNDKLKLARGLRDRRRRDRSGLFLSEGEDLLESGLAAGARPQLVLSAAGTGLGGTEVEPALLDRVSALGSGTRVVAVWPQRWAQHASGPVCCYLHGVGDPRNVGALIRSADALAEGTVVLGPGCADPFSPQAVRASMGSVFGQLLVRGGITETPTPRVGLVAHGGELPEELRPPLTICLGAEREGLPGEVVAACERTVTIPLRPGGAESLNVAAAAAIVLQRISSAAPERTGGRGHEAEKHG